MADIPIPIAFHAYITETRRISIMIWNAGHSDGATLSFKLTEQEARRIGAELLAVADRMPRVASEADIGLVAS